MPNFGRWLMGSTRSRKLKESTINQALKKVHSKNNDQSNAIQSLYNQLLQLGLTDEDFFDEKSGENNDFLDFFRWLGTGRKNPLPKTISQNVTTNTTSTAQHAQSSSQPTSQPELSQPVQVPPQEAKHQRNVPKNRLLKHKSNNKHHSNQRKTHNEAKNHRNMISRHQTHHNHR